MNETYEIIDVDAIIDVDDIASTISISTDTTNSIVENNILDLTIDLLDELGSSTPLPSEVVQSRVITIDLFDEFRASVPLRT